MSTTDAETSLRLTFLGLIAWISLCLILIGWGPSLNPNINRLIAATGLVGLASAVGLASNVRREIREQKGLLTTYMCEANTDPLTSLANRRALDQELERRIAQWRRQDAAFSLLLVDIDHFKHFNDNHGHQAGDEMLRAVGRTLAATMRDMDLVTRYGGEEFAAVLPGTELEDALLAAERARVAVSGLDVVFRGQRLECSVSIGVAQAVVGDNLEALLRRTDDALYAAKKAGRNLVRYDGSTTGPILIADTQEPCLSVES